MNEEIVMRSLEDLHLSESSWLVDQSWLICHTREKSKRKSPSPLDAGACPAFPYVSCSRHQHRDCRILNEKRCS